LLDQWNRVLFESLEDHVAVFIAIYSPVGNIGDIWCVEE
jgi:hypothetical protein